MAGYSRERTGLRSKSKRIVVETDDSLARRAFERRENKERSAADKAERARRMSEMYSSEAIEETASPGFGSQSEANLMESVVVPEGDPMAFQISATDETRRIENQEAENVLLGLLSNIDESKLKLEQAQNQYEESRIAAQRLASGDKSAARDFDVIRSAGLLDERKAAFDLIQDVIGQQEQQRTLIEDAIQGSSSVAEARFKLQNKINQTTQIKNKIQRDRSALNSAIDQLRNERKTTFDADERSVLGKRISDLENARISLMTQSLQNSSDGLNYVQTLNLLPETEPYQSSEEVSDIEPEGPPVVDDDRILAQYADQIQYDPSYEEMGPMPADYVAPEQADVEGPYMGPEPPPPVGPEPPPSEDLAYFLGGGIGPSLGQTTGIASGTTMGRVPQGTQIIDAQTGKPYGFFSDEFGYPLPGDKQGGMAEKADAQQSAAGSDISDDFGSPAMKDPFAGGLITPTPAPEPDLAPRFSQYEMPEISPPEPELAPGLSQDLQIEESSIEPQVREVTKKDDDRSNIVTNPIDPILIQAMRKQYDKNPGKVGPVASSEMSDTGTPRR